MLIDMVYNKDALARVTKQVDELRSSSETDRERDYWAMTRAALELPNLAKAFTPPKPLAGREACRQNMSILTAAQMAYRVINKTELFAKNIRDLAAAMDGKPLPTCPDGGKYSVSVGVPKNAFTIHCSIAEHDAGGRGEPNGYSPGLNTK